MNVIEEWQWYKVDKYQPHPTRHVGYWMIQARNKQVKAHGELCYTKTWASIKIEQSFICCRHAKQRNHAHVRWSHRWHLFYIPRRKKPAWVLFYFMPPTILLIFKIMTSYFVSLFPAIYTKKIKTCEWGLALLSNWSLPNIPLRRWPCFHIMGGLVVV